MGKFCQPLALVSVLAVLALGAARASALGEEHAASRPGPIAPIAFAENRGQCAPEVLFQARVPGLVVSVLADGLHLALGTSEAGDEVRLRFHDTASSARAEGLDALRARAHYLGAAGATRDVPTFGRVRLSGLYPGIDLVLHECAGRIEYDLELAPGADAEVIALSCAGSGAAWVDERGDLCTGTELGTFVQQAPLSWQLGHDGTRTQLSSAWRAREGQRFGFELGAHARDLPVVIDPLLVYGTYVGGSNADEATAAFLDHEGAVYATGWARSVDFPLSASAADGDARGREGVVFKLGPDGRELLYATYFGGRGDDEGVAIQVDRAGRAFVAGNTESDDFPTTHGTYMRRPAGGPDGFVLALSADGSSIELSTRLGGSAEDRVAAMALSPNGSLTVAGTTRSRNFPVTSAGFQTRAQGGREAFVVRLDPRAQDLVFATLLGGSEDDEASALALDAEGCVYVAGRTLSSDFPVTVAAFDRQRCGVDAFVAKVSGRGRTLLYSTFLGGSGSEEATSIAVGEDGRAVVVGWTQSLDFPFDPGVRASGRKDGFAVRLSDTGNQLSYARPIGGSSADEALGVSIAADGTAWVVGSTRSIDFPRTDGALRAGLAGVSDAFLVALEGADGALRYATYLGGAGEDRLVHAHGDRAGEGLVLSGWSAGIGAEGRGPLAGKRRGSADAFVLRFDLRDVPPAVAPASGGVQAGVGLGF